MLNFLKILVRLPCQIETLVLTLQDCAYRWLDILRQEQSRLYREERNATHEK